MKKIFIGLICLIAAAGIILVINSAKDRKIISSIPSGLNPTATVLAYKKYGDPSGFSFQYPDNFVVSPDKVSNDQIYASVKLNYPNKAETINLKIESSDLSSVDDWFTPAKKNKIPGEIKKLKLADLQARQFISNNQRVTLAVDDGILISIIQDATKDETLSSTYDKVISSFDFVQPTATVSNNSSANTSGDDVVFEGEEAVE